MNFVQSGIYYAIAPMSIRDFDRVKEQPDIKEDLDKASLYFLATREVPSIRLIDDSALKRELNRQYSEDKYVILRISLKEQSYEIDVAYVLPEEISRDEFISLLSGITVEELFYNYRRGAGKLFWNGEIDPLVTYMMLYVGECVGESLTDRFKSHHALQKMLINESVISRDDDKAEEIMLFPCCIDSDTFSLLNSQSPKEDFHKAINNDFDFGLKEVFLDAEKALIHNMNPKYNRMKFQKYPLSDNGLNNSDASVYCYYISEFAKFKYNEGILQGHPAVTNASKIVGDKTGDTRIYCPGDDVVERYFRFI